MKNLRAMKGLRPEFFLTVLMIVLMAVNVNYAAKYKVHGSIAISDSGSIILLHSKEEIQRFNEAGRTTMKYEPDSCRMIEVFDEDLEPTFRIVYADLPEDYYPIDEYPIARTEYTSKERGNFKVTTPDNDTVTVYFAWFEFPDTDNRYLVSFSSSDIAKQRLIINEGVEYGCIAIAFTLLGITMYWQTKGIINRYHRDQQRMMDQIRM